MAVLTWIGGLAPAAQLVAVLAVVALPLLAVIVRACTRVAVERERTRRLAQSISAVPSARRSEVIRAQATVEASYLNPRASSVRGARASRRVRIGEPP